MNMTGLKEEKNKLLSAKYAILKLKDLDKDFTFNENDVSNPNYLMKLNKFLYGDFYHCNVEALSTGIVLSYLAMLKESFKNNDIDKIKKYTNQFLGLRPVFETGNTETILGYLIVLKDMYNIDLDLDVENIILTGKIFEEKNKTM